MLPSGPEAELREGTQRDYGEAAAWVACDPSHGRVTAAVTHWASEYQITLQRRKLSALVAQAASELEPPAETLLATAEPHYQEAAARVGPNPPHGKIQAVISEWSEKHVHLDYRTLCRRVQALTRQSASLTKYPASAPQSAFVPKAVLVPRGRQQLLPPIAMEFAAFVLGSGQCLSRCAVDGADRELFRMLLWFTRGMDCLSRHT